MQAMTKQKPWRVWTISKARSICIKIDLFFQI